MVTCEHFLHALFPDVGIKLLKSPRLWQLVDTPLQTYLQHLADHATEPTVIQMWFPDRNLISVSYVKPVTDQHGRQGTWNHTIIVKIDEFLQISQPSTILSPFLIRSLDAPPQVFPPIEVR
jgi:hypothetical protein